MLLSIFQRMMNKKPIQQQEQLALVLLYRLEKISADSPWAHQASGIRASIAKTLSREERSSNSSASRNLEGLLKLGFEILEKAAGEIPEDSSL